MGSLIEINDTLQITKEQGFPKELNIDIHLKQAYSIEQLKDTIFEFKNKPNIRVFQAPPVRCFLVENINGKWVYWGLVHIIEVTHNNINKTTSGKFKIIQLYSPTEMKETHKLIDGNKKTNYFN